jgi:hypothetical protein
LPGSITVSAPDCRVDLGCSTTKARLLSSEPWFCLSNPSLLGGSEPTRLSNQAGGRLVRIFITSVSFNFSPDVVEHHASGCPL